MDSLNKMDKKWQRIGSKYLGDYRIFRMRQDTRRSPRTGNEHNFFVLETPDWINVIPVTPDDHVVMVRQFRHGSEEMTLEIPAGMVDPTDSSPAESALRELREETGYTTDTLIKLGSVAPNPAFLDNQCHLFLAQNVQQTTIQELDGAEDISIELLTWAELYQLVDNGGITHSLTLNALFWYERYLKSHPTT